MGLFDASKSTLLCVFYLSLRAQSAAVAADVHLMRGKDYPLCVSVTKYISNLPQTLKNDQWLNNVKNNGRFDRPNWVLLPAAEHTDSIQAFFEKRYALAANNQGLKPDIDTLRSIDQMVLNYVNQGKIRLEETTLNNFKIGSGVPQDLQAPWTTNAVLRRVGIDGAIPIPGDVSIFSYKTNDPIIWAYFIKSFREFPDVKNDLIQRGEFGLEVMLVQKQPWFIVLPGVIATPYTNDLASENVDADHEIYLRTRCVISFLQH